MPTMYYALLGSHPVLSELELNAILPENVIPVCEKLVAIPSMGTHTPQSLQQVIGGTIKILKQVSQTQLTPDAPHESSNKIIYPDLVAISAEVLAELHQNDSNCTFSITSLLPEDSVNNTHVKKKVQSVGLKARFRDGKRPYGVSAAVLIDSPITELFLFDYAGALLVAQSVAWQDIDEWTYHDRSRPFADRKRGMLPLKVARMLLNIATQGNYNDHYVYDPFCGSGSIIQEALELGIPVTGSDVSSEAVHGTKENADWYIQTVLAEKTNTLATKNIKTEVEHKAKNKIESNQTQTPAMPHVFVADVTQVLPKHLKQQPTAIVTEPFLGKQTAAFRDLPNIYKGLYKLYKGAFSTWLPILPSGGKIVIIFPSVSTGRIDYTLNQLIDELPNLGYNIDLGPIVYARPDAHTRRHVYIISRK